MDPPPKIVIDHTTNYKEENHIGSAVSKIQLLSINSIIVLVYLKKALR